MRVGWNGEPGKGLDKPPDLIGKPFHPKKVQSFFTAHVVSHYRVGNKSRDL